MGRNPLSERRQELIRERIEEDPFITDRELAREFGVSVQTIRLDRLKLGIPEVRERTRRVAEQAYAKVRSILVGEIIGELVDISLGESGISILEATPDMAFRKTRIVRGHHIFAQANSLAVAIIDASVVLTGSASVKFRRPVYAGQRLVAKARVLGGSGARHEVMVSTRVGDDEVFSGKFVVHAIPEDGGTME